MLRFSGTRAAQGDPSELAGGEARKQRELGVQLKLGRPSKLGRNCRNRGSFMDADRFRFNLADLLNRLEAGSDPNLVLHDHLGERQLVPQVDTLLSRASAHRAHDF